jgi:hypothetical protein
MGWRERFIGNVVASVVVAIKRG